MANNNPIQDQLGIFDTGYQFKLENFEGPLDLLLHLIKESKLEIFEVKLADITDQYLQYMNELDSLDMDKASDFIDMAATLIEIKSKSLLPRDEEADPEEEDDEMKLLKRLQEYKLFKEACEKLKDAENIDRFYRAPDEKVNDYRYVLKDMQLENLLNAFALMMTRIRKEEKAIEPRKIVRDRWTVAEKITSIKEALSYKKKLIFTELFDSDYSKSEVINVFLALLELLKMQQVTVVQNGTYEQIEIHAREDEPQGEENVSD